MGDDTGRGQLEVGLVTHSGVRDDKPLAFAAHLGHFAAEELSMLHGGWMGSPADSFIKSLLGPLGRGHDDGLPLNS